MEIITGTDRIILAVISSDDAELLFQLTSNPFVMKYFPRILDRTETENMVKKIIHQYSVFGHSFWKIIDRETRKFIGIAGLLHQEVDGSQQTGSFLLFK